MASRDDAPSRLNWKLIAQGAEARIYDATFLQQPAIVKERFKKEYRHPTLDDKLTRDRLSLEGRSLVRARAAGVDAPLLLFVDTICYRLFMERINGITVKEFLRSRSYSSSELTALATSIGTGIARLHNSCLIHGDLTTSNLMLRTHRPDGRRSSPLDWVTSHNLALSSGLGRSAVFSAAATSATEAVAATAGSGDSLLSIDSAAAAVAASQSSSDSPNCISGGHGSFQMLRGIPTSAAASSSTAHADRGTVASSSLDAAVEAISSSSTSSSCGGQLSPNLVFIDFGLSFVSAATEDKGVDLYVLERALLSTHTDIPDFFGSVMDAYLAASTDADAVKSRFEAVRLRGRKRMAFG